MQRLQVTLTDNDVKFVDVVERAVALLESIVSVTSRLLDDVRADTDLVLYEAPACGIDGFDALAAHTRTSRVPVAVFTDMPSVDSALEYLRAGALGYLSKHTSSGQLAWSIEHLLAGNVTIDPTIAGQLARSVACAPTLSWSGMADGLTRREGEVLDLLRRGFTNREIADRFVIGMQTVKSHAHRIYAKLGVTGRGDLH